MDEPIVMARINDLSTWWSVVRAAHGEQQADVRAAQKILLERYGQAAFRYLRRLVGNEDAARNLYQDFAVRFLEGAFRGADPLKGRFRDYLKTVLYRLATRHRHEEQKKPLPLPDDLSVGKDDCVPEFADDQVFLQEWRKELLNTAWEELAKHQQQTRGSDYTILRLKRDHPELSAAQMAEQLGQLLGKPMSSDATRKGLERARKKFASLLRDAVRQSLDDPTQEQLEQELLDLDLLKYCRSSGNDT